VEQNIYDPNRNPHHELLVIGFDKEPVKRNPLKRNKTPKKKDEESKRVDTSDPVAMLKEKLRRN